MPPPRRGQGGSIPGLPPEFRLFTLEATKGINTKDARPAIDDQELSWMENYLRIGNGNMRTLWDVGASVYTPPGGKTVVSFFPFNIGSTQYHAVFLSDGTADAVNLSASNTVTHISAVAGTFFTAGGVRPACAQWGAQYLLITSNITSNSYWVWDGTSLFTAGTVSPITTITNAGSGYTSAPTVTATGGSGSGATFTATVTNGSVTAIKVTAPGSGYLATDSTPLTLAFSGGGGTGAAGTVNLMPFGVSGTSLETYQGHVWVQNNATDTFSAPGSFDVFATSKGGGSFSSTDSFLRTQYVAIKQTNGYLYPFGDSSINVVSNVQSSGSPVTTSFNNSNTDPQVGTPWRDSVQAYGRALVFANPTGIYGLYGGAAERLSEKLDGIFADATLPVSGTALPPAAVATIFSIKVYLALVTIMDPFTGQNRPAMLAWDGKTFFVASQSKSLIYIATQEINSLPLAWGTDGAGIYQLFAQPSASLTKTFQSKLWAGDGYLVQKQALALYTQAEDNSGAGFTLTVDIDNESSSAVQTIMGGATFTWINNSGGTFTWVNNSSGTFTWGSAGLGINIQDAQAYGRLLGVTVTSTSPDFTFVSMSIGYRNFTGTG